MKNKTTKRKYNSKKKSHKSHAGIKSPTSISFEKDKTPRLSGDNDIGFRDVCRVPIQRCFVTQWGDNFMTTYCNKS